MRDIEAMLQESQRNVNGTAILELRPLSDNTTCVAPYDITHEIHENVVTFQWKGDAQYYDLRCYDYVNDVQENLDNPKDVYVYMGVEQNLAGQFDMFDLIYMFIGLKC